MNDTDDLENIWPYVENAQKDAISDKVKVGALVIGVNNTGHQKHFTGANLHVSDSFADVHAEQLAVNLCLLERYYPIAIFVSSQSDEEDVILCGSCRHYISEINNKCRVVVFNPDGTKKHEQFLFEVYPNSKDTNDKNSRFQELCGIVK